LRRRWAARTSKACRRRSGGSLGVAATVKHFAGYSQSINGHDRNEALLPLSYLQSVILPS
jgi:beta-glucosidase